MSIDYCSTPCEPHTRKVKAMPSWGKISLKWRDTKTPVQDKDDMLSPSSDSGKIKDLRVRRSARKTQAVIVKEKEEEIKARLLASDDTNLGLEVATFGNKGRGIKAGRDFVKGEFIVEYAGDLIDGGTAVEREENYAMDITKGSYMYFFKLKEKKYW